MDHINIDKTKPRVSYRGNAGRYAVDQQIHITCRASDRLSGIARSTCAGLQRPAYRLGIGAHTISAIATDKAGNTGSGSASFTVTVTTASLCRLTRQFLQGNRQATSTDDKSADIVTATCRRLVSNSAELTSRGRRAELIALYEEALAPPIRSGLLKPGQEQPSSRCSRTRSSCARPPRGTRGAGRHRPQPGARSARSGYRRIRLPSRRRCLPTTPGAVEPVLDTQVGRTDRSDNSHRELREALRATQTRIIDQV